MSQLTQIPADTLTNTGATTLPSSTEALKAIFGPEAHLSPALPTDMELLGEMVLTESWVVRIVMLALFVGYAVAMWLYGSHVGDMWKIVVGRNIGIKVADELSYLFVRAMLVLSGVGVVAISVAAVKVLGLCGVELIEGVAPEWTAPVVIAAMCGALGVMWVATRAICALTGRGEVAEGLEVTAIAVGGLTATIITPCVLLFVLGSGTSAIIIGTIIALCTAIAMLCFVMKSFIFFVEQKISILLWILYLCTVVLIPLGVVVTTIIRNGAI